jgi:hypothetical protein
MGYKWAALELDDYGNSQIWGPFRLSCQAAGIMAGIWVTEGAHINTTPADAQFAIAECEGPGDYDGIMAAISAGQLPSCPKAIVTNFNHPLYSDGTPAGDGAAIAAAAPLINAGFACLTEAYMGDNPNADPNGLDSYGRFLKWPATSPVFGVYNEPMTTYDPYKNTFPGWSVYLAEYVL